MSNLPFWRVSVTEEDTSGGSFERVKWVGFIDLLREEIGFRESDGSNFRVIGLVGDAALVACSDNRPIFLEKTLVVSKMIRKNFEEGPEKR